MGEVTARRFESIDNGIAACWPLAVRLYGETARVQAPEGNEGGHDAVVTTMQGSRRKIVRDTWVRDSTATLALARLFDLLLGMVRSQESARLEADVRKACGPMPLSELEDMVWKASALADVLDRCDGCGRMLYVGTHDRSRGRFTCYSCGLVTPFRPSVPSIERVDRIDGRGDIREHWRVAGDARTLCGKKITPAQVQAALGNRACRSCSVVRARRMGR